MSSSSSRPDNVSVAAEPAKSPLVPAASTTTCELTDQAWAQAKYLNFRLFVRSLVPQEPKLAEWADWLTGIPISVFLAGGDQELKGVREASTEEQRSTESMLVLERWALQYGFDLSKIKAEDKLRLTRYLLLFASC